MNLGDVCWINFPSRGGHEQAGRRPGIILQNGETSAQVPTVLTVPLTTQLGSLRYPATVLVEADTENGLRRDSVALVFQLTAIDSRQIEDCIGTVDPVILDEILMVLAEITHEVEAAPS